MPERGGKDQGNDSPKQVGSFWFTDVVASFCGSAFVLFCFLFVFVILLKPRPFVQSFFFLRYACVSTATRVLSVSSFFFEMSIFPNNFHHYIFAPYGKYLARIFYLVTMG